MEKIFYTDVSKFPTSERAVTFLLEKYFQITDGKIYRTESGKPYLQHGKRLFFSVSHTKTTLFIAFSTENVGIDAESLSRSANYAAIVKKFPIEEREEITDERVFLRHWTVKESAVKWLGGTIAQDLKKLSFVKNSLRYENLEIPVHILTKEVDGHILSVCAEKDFSAADIIKV